MTAERDFVHLHLHSEFSLLDGANRLQPMVERVREMGMPAVALTDHGNMFGALAFQKAARAAGVKPILGCELYVAPGSRHDRKTDGERHSYHLLALAKNRAGYRNLCKLSTIGYLEGFYYKPRVDMETLAAHSEGLIVTTGCLAGQVPKLFERGQDAEATALMKRFVEIFGAENYFLELQDHGIKLQHALNRRLIPLAKDLGLKLIATNDAHYLCRENAIHQDAAICIQTAKKLDDTDRMRFQGDQFYVKDPREMWALFGEVPEALLNTRLVAEMCDAEIETGSYHLPTFECPDGLDQAEHLRRLVFRGLAKRYGEVSPEHERRANYELGVIHDMGFDGYFLVVWDFIRYARESGIPVGPGRGSAAGSLVAYALEITDLCPLDNGLIFERFLNPGRHSMPDIDIDFCFERRGEVIEYVRRKYGRDQVAQIITFGTLKAKAAVRDVGRILNMPIPEVDRIAKLIPDGPNVTLESAFQSEPELRRIAAESEETERLFDYARALEGTIRHASTHAAGIVIGDQDLTEYLPLYRPPNSEDVATQFTMTEVEEIGLLKMDFLGLKNLTIIENCTRMLRAKGIEIDWDEINLHDEATFALMSRGDTHGVFQLESSGMRNLLTQVKPSSFSDIVAMIALYRPGPLESGMASAYARRKHGLEKVVYDHPTLEPILEETHGVILYQEQVMQIAQTMCGFSMADADVLRKAMGKKIKEVMDQQAERFIDGAVANGVDEAKAKRIWDNIVTFAGYGFNKSHSAAYAVITFRTAYLKAHHPTEYTAALLTNEISGSNSTEKIAFYMDVCRPMGIAILPPDVNESNHDFTVVREREIRFGLEAIKGVGHGAARALIEEREKDGPYLGLEDLCQRVDLNRVNMKVCEWLIKSGAMDNLPDRLHRSQRMHILPEAYAKGQAIQRERESKQETLFDVPPGENTIRAPDIPEWVDSERLEHEKSLLGTYLTGHPLDRHRELFEQYDLTSSDEILELPAGAKVDFIGIVRKMRPITTKKGDRMAFVTLEDYRGQIETVVFADAFSEHRDKLVIDGILWAKIHVGQRNGERNLVVNGLQTPETAAQGRRQHHRFGLPMPPGEVTAAVDTALREILDVLRAHPGERYVKICVTLPSGETVEFSTGIRVTPSEDLERKIRAIWDRLFRD